MQNSIERTYPIVAANFFYETSEIYTIYSSIFFRLVQNFSDILKHTFALSFIWTYASTTGSFLMFQIELVELFCTFLHLLLIYRIKMLESL